MPHLNPRHREPWARAHGSWRCSARRAGASPPCEPHFSPSSPLHPLQLPGWAGTARCRCWMSIKYTLLGERGLKVSGNQTATSLVPPPLSELGTKGSKLQSLASKLKTSGGHGGRRLPRLQQTPPTTATRHAVSGHLTPNTITPSRRAVRWGRVTRCRLPTAGRRQLNSTPALGQHHEA